jgi:dephospho-CoA kinase
MFLLGLTGDIACGKSTVARLLQGRGAAHIDADALVHELYQNPSFARQLQSHLRGIAPDNRVLDELLDAQQHIDRRVLGTLVFQNAALLRQLEAQVHPAVAHLREEKLRGLRSSAAPPRVVVLEAVKLVESGQVRPCNCVWWVTASPEIQRQRLVEQRGLSEEAAQSRLDNQPSRQSKLRQLTEWQIPFNLIPNDGSLNDLEARVRFAWDELLAAVADDFPRVEDVPS